VHHHVAPLSMALLVLQTNEQNYWLKSFQIFFSVKIYFTLLHAIINSGLGLEWLHIQSILILRFVTRLWENRRSSYKTKSLIALR